MSKTEKILTVALIVVVGVLLYLFLNSSEKTDTPETPVALVDSIIVDSVTTVIPVDTTKVDTTKTIK